MRFRRRRNGAVEADLAPAEVAVLAHAVADLLRLLAGEEQADDVDPLEAMVGMGQGPVERPDDPALRRLFPDAYRPDAATEGLDLEQASAEFRRYTEPDLRAGKRRHADVVLETLARGGSLVLDRDECDAWLGTLNDLRLVLGVRLDVDDETLERPLPLAASEQDELRQQALEVYAWLGWVQELLLESLEPRAQ